ncbi:MAG: cobyrinic acid a,c-diamide synthase, partial [Methanohalophilus sp. T328-1]
WDGMTVENTLGSYAHLEGVSYREFARSFVDSILE